MLSVKLWKHSALPQPSIAISLPLSLSNHHSVETAPLSYPSHSVIHYNLSLSLSSLSPPTLQRGAQSDRCNTAVEAWAELAGCRGQTRASSSDWREQRRGDGSGGGSRNKTAVVGIVWVVAVQFQSRLCLRIWMCWSRRSSACEFNMDPDTSTHPEAQHGEWDLKCQGGRKGLEMMRMKLWEKLNRVLVNKEIMSQGFPVSLLLWLGSPFGS